MDTQRGTLHMVAQHLVLALAPLKDAVSDLSNFQTLLYRLAWKAQSMPPEYTALAAKVDAALTALDGLGDHPPPAKIFDLFDKVTALYQALKTINTAPEGVDPAVFLPEIGRALFDLLLVDYLVEQFPGVYSALQALGIITQEFTVETSARPGVLISRVHWSDIPRLLSEPDSLPARVYGWGTNDLEFSRIASHLLGVFVAMEWPAYIGRVEAKLSRGFLDDPDDVPEMTIEWALKIPVVVDNIGGKDVEVGLALLELPPQGGKPAGLVLQPLIPPAIGTSYDISEDLKLDLRAGSDVAQTFGVLVRPGDVAVKYPFQEGATLPAAGFGVTLRYAPASPSLLLGDGSATRLSMQGAATSISLDAHEDSLELKADIAPTGLTLVLAAQDQDGFLGTLIGDRDVTVPIPLTVQWSNLRGVSFAGGAGFTVAQSVHRSLGPITIQKVQLALHTTADSSHPPDVLVDAGISVAGNIGPLTIAVDNVGLRLRAAFQDGNAGPFDIGAGFMPPDGVGVSIDSAGVSGGGFLFNDPARHLYAGVMQLTLQERITVKAVGLIETRMPDDSRGYSMAIFITAEDFKPIPLGMGFMLEGIGGMLAINRTFDETAMRNALKTGALEGLLFPKDPIRNASDIVRNLATVFPARRGNYLLGPLAKISWPTPTLISMQLALIFEFGARRRLIALGRVSSILPSPKHDLIRVNIDAMGLIDFDEGTASLDGVLVDSRLAQKFVLTGNMAMRSRLSLGPGGGFALAIGGFNPHFAPPLGFPPLDRITINLTSGDNPRFTCEAYYAITPNTIQFGSRAQLYAAAYGFSIQGDVGFDVLIHLLPFHFLADFHASIQLKRGSRNLFKVSVAGALEGPLPLRISAKATFEILWCDFSIRFDKTLVSGIKPPLPPGIDVLAELLRVLTDQQSWSTRRSGNRQHGITLRKLQPGTALTLDPLGNMMVKQSVVPLNTTRDLDVFGGVPITGARKFNVTATLGGQQQQVENVKELFAPAQFFEMSDDDKLSSPSFEEMDAGIIFGSDVFTFDETQIVAAPLEFETIVIDAAGKPSRPQGGRYLLTADRLFKQSRIGAAAIAPIRVVGAAKFRQPDAPRAVTLEPPRWVVASTLDTNLAAPVIVSGPSWIESRAALATLNRTSKGGAARWQVVPAYEALQ